MKNERNETKNKKYCTKNDLYRVKNGHKKKEMYAKVKWKIAQTYRWNFDQHYKRLVIFAGKYNSRFIFQSLTLPSAELWVIQRKNDIEVERELYQAKFWERIFI